MPKTILLVDDHPVFRQGLRQLLDKEKDLKVVGEASDGLIAIGMVKRLSPDVVVMDISMPNLDGMKATHLILSEHPDTRIVALSVHSGKHFVGEMLVAGAVGYILKESVSEEIVRGIRTVLAGDIYLSRTISGIVVSEYRRLRSKDHDISGPPLTPILSTKLHRPAVTADIIPRLRLLELLEAGHDRAMTLVSAPAGYGKSILVSQWLEVCSRPWAWVSLDEEDSDLRQFITYVLTAVQKMFPAMNPKIWFVLKEATLPPVRVLSRYLLNDMELAETPFILVLDDYQHIRGPAVHELLSEMLRYPSPMMHLTLVTRRDPPLPVVSLRARGQLTEITVKELRFTAAETATLLNRFLRLAIEERTAAIVEERVEGWVTGLRLLALTLGKEKNSEQILKGILEESVLVQEYLIQEVLSHVPEAVARHMMEVSILDRFSASLCDAVFASGAARKRADDEMTGASFITWLEETRLFVVSLDDEHRWFRYHHLFRELLHHQLKLRTDSNHINVLHRRAAEWFENNHLLEEALKHVLAAGDQVAAAQWVEQDLQSALDKDEWYLIDKWLSRLPDTLVRQRPRLLMARAYVLYQHYDLPGILSVLDTIGPVVSDAREDRSVWGEIEFYRGFICISQNRGSLGLTHLANALANVPETHQRIRGDLDIYHGLALQMNGQGEEAVRTLNELLDQSNLLHGMRVACIQGALVYIHIISGDLDTALLIDQQLAGHCSLENLAHAQAWSEYLHGVVLFLRSDFEEAIRHFRQAMDNKYMMHRRAVFDNMAGLALSYQATHQIEQVHAAMRDLSEYVGSLGDSMFSMMIHSIQARLSILQGDVKAASAWLEENFLVEDNMLFWLEIPAVTSCRALLAEGSDESLEKAEARLQELLKLNQQNHNILHMIEVLALLAVAFMKRAKTKEALDAAQQAVGLAEKGGFISPFLELGPPMAELLKRLQKRNVADAHIRRVLTAFKDAELRAEQVVVGRQVESSFGLKGDSLSESLTQREQEVLALLANGLNNKEIASKLYLSPETVKKHLYNIYQKLDVKNRVTAIARARELGFTE